MGSDRTTYTGDVANKIGTYLKALTAYDNGARKTNEITALPAFIEQLARKGVNGVVFAFDAISTPKKLVS